MKNVLAITHDGRAITTQTMTEGEAFIRLATWAGDIFYTNGRPLARFFVGDDNGLGEYSAEDVRALAAQARLEA